MKTRQSQLAGTISEGAPLHQQDSTRPPSVSRCPDACGSRRVGAHRRRLMLKPVAPFGVPCDSVGVSGIPYVPGVNCRLMAVDGYTRHYIVWVPLSGVPANAPAVIMHHGASGNGGQFLRTSGWREKATQEDFVAIFPTAVEHFVLETQRFSTRWNNYGLPAEIDPNQRPAGYPATSPWPADDVKFIRQIGADVIQQLSTDPHRVYVAGFSSGGGMCARLGVEASDLIAAVACHGSGLHELHETLVGSRNLSAYFSIGTLDGNALDAINSYLIALGQPADRGAAAQSFRSRPDPANQDPGPVESGLLQSRSDSTHHRDRCHVDGASCTDGTTRQQRWKRVVLRLSRRCHPSVSQRDEQSRRVQPARLGLAVLRAAPPPLGAAEPSREPPESQGTARSCGEVFRVRSVRYE